MSNTSLTQLTGRVKWFNTKTGYGFITVVDCSDRTFLEKDIFCHYSSINTESSQYKYLVQGEYVQFDLVSTNNDKHEWHATNISGIKGGLLMCQTHQQNSSRTSHPYSPRQVPSSGVDEGFTEVRSRRMPRNKPQVSQSVNV